MKYLPIALFLLLINIPEAGRAEYVFKKDGSIVKGVIVSDEIDTISLKNEAGKVERISRKEIIRIIYTELFTGKVYVRLTSGEVIEGYQIDEDRDDYFFRKDLAKPEEFRISRRKVMFIARNNPTDLKGSPSTEFILLTWSPPFKPAKKYRVYVRDAMAKEEKYRIAGETGDLAFRLKNLQKSWSYELYATGISETGEESLPSEKITVHTLPESPVNLAILEKLSKDGKRVTLTFLWSVVTDPLSRVKSYTLYEMVDSDRKKRGTSGGSGFAIEDYPAEGRHWFSVVAVNDLGTESAEIKAVYDAGYKVYIRGMGSYIRPMGVMRQLAASGYGGFLDIGLSAKKLSLGVETGWIIFNGTTDIRSMMMVPALLEVNYRVPLFFNFSFRPVLKAGVSYDMIDYVVHDNTDPLLSSTARKKSFDTMVSAGGYLQCEITERVGIYGGAEYSVLFQKGGRLSFINGAFGIGMIF